MVHSMPYYYLGLISYFSTTPRRNWQIQAEHSVDLSVVKDAPPHMVHHPVTAQSGGTDYCRRTVIMHCPVESLDTTGIIQNMLFATTVSPRYERIGRGFRGFQKTCWYYNIHPIREGSDWIPPCMIKTQGEQRTQLRQQCITLLYICGKYINVLQPSPWAASMHPYAPVLPITLH